MFLSCQSKPGKEETGKIFLPSSVKPGTTDRNLGKADFGKRFYLFLLASASSPKISSIGPRMSRVSLLFPSGLPICRGENIIYFLSLIGS